MKADLISHKITLKRVKNVLPLLSLLFVVACSPSRHLQENQKLLTKVQISVDGEQKFADELKSIPKQKPNRKLLGLFKIYLGVYNLYYNKENSRIKNNIGEAPVVYDSTLDQVSADLMNKYLNNRGYYKSKVETSVKHYKKKVKFEFLVTENERFTIKELSYNITDQNIKNIFQSDIHNSALKLNSAFDLDALKKERERIENLLKDNGYYDFSREYVVFKVDTFYQSSAAHLNISIKNPSRYDAGSDTTIEGKHKIYTISKVMVRLGFDGQSKTQYPADSTIIDSIHFVDYLNQSFKKKVIARITSISAGDHYKLKAQRQTYRNISSLGVFSLVSIRYEQDFDQGGENLVAIIDLNPRKPKSLTFETEGTNNGGNLGVNGTITFNNNNTFKGAEALNISLNGGIEAQQVFTTNEDDQIIEGVLPFNTLEFGPEVSLEIPRFLLPISADKYSAKGNPRTVFNTSYNYQARPDYERRVTKTFIAYSWNETATKAHIIQPIDLSYISLDPSSQFEKFLEEQNSFVKNSYTDNLILALKYSFIYNNKTTNKLKNNIFFRANLESAGNFLALTTNGINDDVDENGTYRILDIQYAQYVRSDIDLRYYQKFDYNQLVYRFAAGIGIPYGNSVALPFEKSFYAGGANGIRAWRARELGPGTLPDSVDQSIDQIGNMNLEANVEFRFKITEIIESTAFIDAGNIWNYNQEKSHKESQFEIDRLWDGTAIGIGTGLRLNFSFFILRFDLATRLKDPALSNPNVIKPQWRLSNLNLGIGYPF